MNFQHWFYPWKPSKKIFFHSSPSGYEWAHNAKAMTSFCCLACSPLYFFVQLALRPAHTWSQQPQNSGSAQQLVVGKETSWGTCWLNFYVLCLLREDSKNMLGKLAVRASVYGISVEAVGFEREGEPLSSRFFYENVAGNH